MKIRALIVLFSFVAVANGSAPSLNTQALKSVQVEGNLKHLGKLAPQIVELQQILEPLVASHKDILKTFHFNREFWRLHYEAAKNSNYALMSQYKQLLKAIKFAAQKHNNHFCFMSVERPLIGYLLEVVKELWSCGKTWDNDTMVAGLLHCVIGKGVASPAEVSEQFGSGVVNIVQELDFGGNGMTIEGKFTSLSKNACNMSKPATLIALASGHVLAQEWMNFNKGSDACPISNLLSINRFAHASKPNTSLAIYVKLGTMEALSLHVRK